ncbi:MAG: DUF5719 family protein [Actinomycetota bacterium]|nr:DUF5719 family protein [Actinomycetota bacterium]
MNASRRAPALAIIAVLLIGGGLLDRRSRSASRTAAVPSAPIAAAAKAASSAWYCTGATASKDGGADGTVILANASQRSLQGTLTVFPYQAVPKTVPIQVAPASSQGVHLSDVAGAAYASAVVELDGGEVVVELAVTGPLGDTVAPCASTASAQWYYADGVTTKDASETLFLFNPFPDDAVVDLVFGTEDGFVTPQALTGLAVQGGTTAVIPVGDFVQRREQVTATITTRAGRLVVDRLQTFDGTAGRKGIALTLGAASTGTLWCLPDGLVTDGVTERYQVFNPTKKEARVEVALALEQGQAEPFILTVPAEGRVTVNANDEARIPKGVSHAATVRSLNGVGVVVERSVDAAIADKRNGVARTLAAQVTARRWVLAAGESDDTVEELVVVQNPGAAPARVSLSILGDTTQVANPAFTNLEVAAGGRRSIRLNDTVKLVGTPVLVTSDQPVVVERVLNRLKGLGMSMSIGIPLRD